MADLIKSAIDGHDEGIANKAIQEIHAKLTDLSIGHLSLIEKATFLSNENATLKAENLDIKQKLFQHEKKIHDLANYERHATLGGGVVFRNKVVEQGAAIADPYICANCVNRGQKTFLQPEQNGLLLKCFKHGNIPSDMIDAAADEFQFVTI
jgi:uncharacterized membrane protein